MHYIVHHIVHHMVHYIVHYIAGTARSVGRLRPEISASRPNQAHPGPRRGTGCLATGSCCYWLWFLYVPLLCYALYFAQEYTELVTAQVRVCST